MPAAQTGQLDSSKVSVADSDDLTKVRCSYGRRQDLRKAGGHSQKNQFLLGVIF